MTSEAHDLTKIVLTAALPPTIAGIASLVSSLLNKKQIDKNARKADIADAKADIANSKADLIAEKTNAIHATTSSLPELRDELREQGARALLQVTTMQEELAGVKLLVAGLIEMHAGAPDHCPFAIRTDAKVTEHEADDPPPTLEAA